MTMLAEGAHRVRGLFTDPLMRNSALIMVTIALTALAGSVFWVVVARLAPAEQVGVASSMVATTEALAYFALLGLNVTVLRTMPGSDRRASDAMTTVVLVGSFGALLAVTYAVLLPAVSPRLAETVHGPLAVTVLAVMVAGSAVNQLTDSVFLAIDRVVANLWVNGVLLAGLKVVLPFALVGAGVWGIYGATSGAVVVAAVVSVVVILKLLPDRVGFGPSQALRAAWRFSVAGYLANSLYLVPQLVIPVLIINAVGPRHSAVYFISFQMVMLVTAALNAVSVSMHAEASRAPEDVRRVTRHAAVAMAAVAAVGGAALALAAPWILAVFGAQYTDEGTVTLRVLAAGTLAVALNLWCAIRLRIAGDLRSMIAVQALSTASTLVLVAVLVDRGTEFVALAWGIGHLIGGVAGWCAARRTGVTP